MGMGQQQRPAGPPVQQVTVRFDDMAVVTCECGAEVFLPAEVIRKVPAVLSPTGRGEVIHVQVWVCADCGAWYTDLGIKDRGEKAKLPSVAGGAPELEYPGPKPEDNG